MCLAVPGQVISIADDQLRTATISFGGTMKEVSLALVPEAGVGDYVIVHVGFAISKLDEEAARRSLELMAQLDKGEARGQGPGALGTVKRSGPLPQATRRMPRQR